MLLHRVIDLMRALTWAAFIAKVSGIPEVIETLATGGGIMIKGGNG